MDRRSTLLALSAALKGQPPAGCDWTAVLNLANQSLVTPALAAALEPHAGALPPEIWGFLAEVRVRNAERNRRLWAQLADALQPLNAAGIEPVLLKGAALKATLPDHAPFDRLLSDIDLMVAPAEVEAALAALANAGFSVANRYPGEAVHVVAELGRPTDVGYIDLHQRAPGPPALAETADLATRRRVLDVSGGRVRVPDAASQVLHLVLHDQFHDGDYWRGGFDLRHLADLAQLAPMLTEADWEWLQAAAGSKLVRRALNAQLTAAAELMGGPAPPVQARPTYRRWLSQYAHPRLRLPLTAATLALEWPDLLAHRRAIRGAPETRLRPSQRVDRYRRIATVASGKV